jgi:hypothetical protein
MQVCLDVALAEWRTGERRFQPHTGEWVLPSVVEISMPTGMDLMCPKVDEGGRWWIQHWDARMPTDSEELSLPANSRNSGKPLKACIHSVYEA